MKSSYSLIALAVPFALGLSLVAFADTANAQASSDGSGVVAGQAKSGEPTSGAGSVQLPSPNSEELTDAEARLVRWRSGFYEVQHNPKEVIDILGEPNLPTHDAAATSVQIGRCCLCCPIPAWYVSGFITHDPDHVIQQGFSLHHALTHLTRELIRRSMVDFDQRLIALFAATRGMMTNIRHFLASREKCWLKPSGSASRSRATSL
jgi:hypothetical protein